MKLTILGSGTSLPHPKRQPSGYLLETRGKTVLIDCGDGTTQQLAKLQKDPNDIDLILISHCHLDHIGGLPGLMMSYHVSGRTRPLEMIGPQGFKLLMINLNSTLGSYGFRNATDWLGTHYRLTTTEIKWTYVRKKTISRKPLKISMLPMAHADTPTLGFRIQRGKKVMTYCADTAICSNAINLANKVDLALLECSFPDEHWTPGHLCPKYAGTLATNAGAKNVVLTHFYPICDNYDILEQTRTEYSGSITLAQDLMEITI